jgi:hypothetical protein
MSHVTLKLTLQVCLLAPSIDEASLNEGLGLTCTKSWRAGDSIGQSPTRKRREAGWVWVAPSVDPWSLGPAAEALLDEWEPRAEPLHKWLLESGGKAIVRCNVTSTDGSMPAMILSRELLGRLYSLGVELDIDIIAGAPE